MLRLGLVAKPGKGRKVPFKAMVVGATGAIGSVCARLLAMAGNAAMSGGKPAVAEPLFASAIDATGLPSGQQQLVCIGSAVPVPDWTAYLLDPATNTFLPAEELRAKVAGSSFVPDLLTEPTAELALGLAIAAGRNIMAGDAKVRVGFQGWRPSLYGKGLHGSVASVIGLGAVGLAIAERLQGFGCSKVLGVDLRSRSMAVRQVSLSEAFATSDFVYSLMWAQIAKLF